jgi:hypothetical protein
MANRRYQLNVNDDLGSLPLPPEELWIRPRRPDGLPIAQLAFAGVLLVALVAISPLVTRLMAPRENPGVATTNQPSPFIVATTSPFVLNTGTPAAAASASPTPAGGMIDCPDGLPWLDVSFPPPPGFQPGTGAANAEEAFLRLRPDMRGRVWVTQPFGTRPGAPVWIVADGETFIAQVLGDINGNNWVAYPARFIRCATPPPRPSP